MCDSGDPRTFDSEVPVYGSEEGKRIARRWLQPIPKDEINPVPSHNNPNQSYYRHQRSRLSMSAVKAALLHESSLDSQCFQTFRKMEIEFLTVIQTL